MKTVFSYAKSYKLFIVIALILMLLELTVELLQPLVIAKIIDDGIVAGDRGQIIEYGGERQRRNGHPPDALGVASKHYAVSSS